MNRPNPQGKSINTDSYMILEWSVMASKITNINTFSKIYEMWTVSTEN